MDKIAKQILNSLKCPVCGGQIDLISWTKLDRKPKDQNFSCVYDPDHYGIWFVHWEQPVRIEMERASVYEGSYQYQVFQQHWLGGHQLKTTKIVISAIDAEHRIIETAEKKVFQYDKHLFDFSKVSRERLVNRIKTILVFQ